MLNDICHCQGMSRAVLCSSTSAAPVCVSSMSSHIPSFRFTYIATLFFDGSEFWSGFKTDTHSMACTQPKTRQQKACTTHQTSRPTINDKRRQQYKNTTVPNFLYFEININNLLVRKHRHVLTFDRSEQILAFDGEWSHVHSINIKIIQFKYYDRKKCATVIAS